MVGQAYSYTATIPMAYKQTDRRRIAVSVFLRIGSVDHYFVAAAAAAVAAVVAKVAVVVAVVVAENGLA